MRPKQWLQQMQPAPLYLLLGLSLAHFLAQVILCHLTHSLTLLVDSCHMLCNIIALGGCMMTIKYESQSTNSKCDGDNSESNDSKGDSNASETDASHKECSNEKPLTKITDGKHLRNTFGWARIEVLMMLIVCIFFISLSYSVIVEAIQTLIHISHKTPVSYPLLLVLMGVLGLILNGLCYILIGGYTYHQGTFLHVTTTGEVVLDSVATVDSVLRGQRRLSHLRKATLPIPRFEERESLGEIARDITSCLFVIFCGILVHSVHTEYSKFIDPVLTIISAVTLLLLTYPYLKESGLILLQTIPDKMNIEALHADILTSFPNIINIHDFHVWQLTTRKVILTMHIIFSDPVGYVEKSEEVRDFLLASGITEVTIQPEFQLQSNSTTCGSENCCLMRCKGKGCVNKHCCNGKPVEIVGELKTVCIKNENAEPKADEIIVA